MTRRRIPVLLYHSVARDCDRRFREWAVTPEMFAAHMAHLMENGYRSLTVSQLARALRGGGAELPERPVVVTFDDGFADFHLAAWPELRRAGLTATVFIATGFVGRTSGWLADHGEGDRPMMSWADIEELALEGIECAAHGHDHLQLDTVSEAAAWADLTASRRALEEVVGQVDSFAYPHGYYTRRLQRQVAEAGFTSACAVKHALSATDDDPFAMARLVVRGCDGVEDLRRLLRGDGVEVAPSGGSLRRVGWRAVRRAGGEPLVRRVTGGFATGQTHGASR